MMPVVAVVERTLYSIYIYIQNILLCGNCFGFWNGYVPAVYLLFGNRRAVATFHINTYSSTGIDVPALSVLARISVAFFFSLALGVFHTYFYNHARRLRLKNLFVLELFIFYHFWIQVTVPVSLKRLQLQIYNAYM
jgi:hypothetical protein